LLRGILAGEGVNNILQVKGTLRRFLV
jgi:hypothetical protein